LGISEQTYHRWKKQYAGLESNQVRVLEQIQDENARLKKLVPEFRSDKAILQDIATKKWPARAKEADLDRRSLRPHTTQRACRLVKHESWRVSRNRAYRLYAEEQLQLRPKLPKRHKIVVSRRERFVPTRPNEV